jgi:hypothetical protein
MIHRYLKGIVAGEEATLGTGVRSAVLASVRSLLNTRITIGFVARLARLNHAAALVALNSVNLLDSSTVAARGLGSVE